MNRVVKMLKPCISPHQQIQSAVLVPPNLRLADLSGSLCSFHDFFEVCSQQFVGVAAVLALGPGIRYLSQEDQRLSERCCLQRALICWRSSKHHTKVIDVLLSFNEIAVDLLSCNIFQAATSLGFTLP